MKTCGTCSHFNPHVNPETGRVKPSVRGECDWHFPWPEVWPMAFRGDFTERDGPRRPRGNPVGAWTDARECQCHEPFGSPAPEPKREEQPSLLPELSDD